MQLKKLKVSLTILRFHFNINNPILKESGQMIIFNLNQRPPVKNLMAVSMPSAGRLQRAPVRLDIPVGGF